MVAHYARADDGSPGVIRIGQLAERVVVALPRPCILRTTERPPPRVNENSLAALTGARVSELLALTWAEVRLEDLDDAEIEFAWQVDRRGERGPTNTDGSARTVPIPRELAVVLSRHKLASPLKDPDDFVFATCIGGPLRQRNVGRALRVAQRNAMKDDGGPTFPISPQTGRAWGVLAGASRRAAVDAQLQAYRRQSCALGRRERG